MFEDLELGPKHCGIGLGLIILVFAGAMFIPGVATGLFIDSNADLGGIANTAINLSATGYLDGEAVAAPFFNSPFEVGNVAIDEIRVNISWVATGVGIDWNSFSLDGNLVVKQLNEYDNYIERYSTPIISTETEGFLYVILVLGTDICLAETIADGGWFLEISAPITVVALDEIGVQLSAVPSPRLAGTVNILWSSELIVTGEFSLIVE